MSIWTKILERYLFKVDESTKFQVPHISVNKIPDEKTKFLRVDGFNPKNNNSLITNYYQLGLGSMHKYMLLEVGCQIMEEPVFDTLRTKEQLGYSVFSMLRNTHGIIGLSITVNTQVIDFLYKEKKIIIKTLFWCFVEILGEWVVNPSKNEFSPYIYPPQILMVYWYTGTILGIKYLS